MDNRSAFERQLADEIDYEVGPPHAVDALAITRRAASHQPRRRFHSMSSAIKFAAAAGALTVAGAAFLLVAAGGLSPQDGPVAPPGAVQPRISPSADTGMETSTTPPAVRATGTIGWPPAEVVEPEVKQVPGGNDEQGLMLIDRPIEFSDARLSGLLTTWGNGTTRELAGGRAWIESRTHRIVNDRGAWAGSGHLVRTSSGEPAVDQQSMLLVGEDAYEGFIAYLWLDSVPDGTEMWEALILEAEQPPLPDPVARE